MRNCNIQHMIIYMESRGNPYSLIGEQRLHNFVSNAVDLEVQAQKLLNFRTIADPAYSSFRQDGLLDRVKAVSDTIPTNGCVKTNRVNREHYESPGISSYIC